MNRTIVYQITAKFIDEIGRLYVLSPGTYEATNIIKMQSDASITEIFVFG